jgi:diacylglycerol kinase (ATP)
MEKTATTAVFVNPSAGGGKAARVIALVRADFRQRNCAVTFVEPRSIEELRQSVRTVCANGCRKLVAMGGDGTLQLLVRETLEHEVEIGVIPAGSGNDYAAALGIKNWRQAAEVIAKGRTRRVDLVRVRFANGEQAFYLGGGGVGLDAEAARHASGKFRTWPGRLRYLAAAVAALRRYSGVDVELEDMEDSTPKISGRMLLAAALNTPTYGGGLCLAPDARVADGELDIVTIEMMSRLEILSLIPWLLFKGELKTNRAKRFRTKKIRLSTADEEWLHGDGELLGKTPAEIEVLPGAIRMFVP